MLHRHNSGVPHVAIATAATGSAAATAGRSPLSRGNSAHDMDLPAMLPDAQAVSSLARSVTAPVMQRATPAANAAAPSTVEPSRKAAAEPTVMRTEATAAVPGDQPATRTTDGAGGTDAALRAEPVSRLASQPGDTASAPASTLADTQDPSSAEAGAVVGETSTEVGAVVASTGEATPVSLREFELHEFQATEDAVCEATWSAEMQQELSAAEGSGDAVASQPEPAAAQAKAEPVTPAATSVVAPASPKTQAAVSAESTHRSAPPQAAAEAVAVQPKPLAAVAERASSADVNGSPVTRGAESTTLETASSPAEQAAAARPSPAVTSSTATSSSAAALPARSGSNVASRKTLPPTPVSAKPATKEKAASAVASDVAGGAEGDDGEGDNDEEDETEVRRVFPCRATWLQHLFLLATFQSIGHISCSH